MMFSPDDVCRSCTRKSIYEFYYKSICERTCFLQLHFCCLNEQQLLLTKWKSKVILSIIQKYVLLIFNLLLEDLHLKVTKILHFYKVVFIAYKRVSDTIHLVRASSVFMNNRGYLLLIQYRNETHFSFLK